MPLRNPFARRPPAVVHTGFGSDLANGRHPGFERVDNVGSRASSALSIRSRRSHDTGEYKMSVVNDSGVYLPPSPTEHRAQVPRRCLSRTSSDTPSSSLGGEIEHFSISRESFDSYRRSFDISARSPVASLDTPSRQSLDSARLHRHLAPPRSALDRSIEGRVWRQPPTPEEAFEDIGLDDGRQPQQPPARRRGFLSKLGEPLYRDSSAQPAVARFLMPGRKRGQSGQGSELGVLDRPTPADADGS